jgi:hypothetical protein
VVSIRVDENEKVLYDRFASVLDSAIGLLTPFILRGSSQFENQVLRGQDL